MRFKEQIVTPILGNLPLFTLSWSLVAVIAIVAKDPNCRQLGMGHSEQIIQAALGLPWKNVVLSLMCFYLFAGLLFSLTKQSDRTAEIQTKFLRPIAVPVLFQIAGLSGGLTAEGGGDHAMAWGIAVAVAIVALALAVYNVVDAFNPD